MFINKTVGLWLARKALYGVIGGVLAGASGYVMMHADPNFNLKTLQLSSFLGAVGGAVVGDLKRKILPDFMQIVVGQDPREDG